MRKTVMTVLLTAVLAGPVGWSCGWAQEPEHEPGFGDDEMTSEGEGRGGGWQRRKGRPGEQGRMGQGRFENEDERAALEFLQQAYPDKAEMFRGKPQMRGKLRRLAPLLKNPEMRKKLMRQIELEKKARSLAKELKQAEGERKEELEKDLREILSEQFDAKLSLHMKRLDTMKDSISKLEKRISKRRSLKDKIIDKRLNELSGEAETWDW